MTPLPNKEIKLSELLGPLPDQKACEQAGGLTPDQFLAVYRAANEDDRQVMKRFLLARFHELARRGVISYPGLMALVGPERAGVNGSRRFGVAPIPLGSYNALLNYLESVALMIGGPDYVPSDASRERLDRALQASLAISSNEVRLQYRDFDVVWSNVLRDLTCAEQAGKPSRPPGIFWLYAQVRESAGLAWMPTLPAGLAERVEDEGGALFARAREETRVMPESLAAVTAWKCDEISQ